MTDEMTPTHKAMLNKIGFKDDLEMFATLKDTTISLLPAQQRALKALIAEFMNLDFAEREITLALHAMSRHVDAESDHLANALAVSSMWVTQAATKMDEYTVKMKASIDKICTLAWVYNDTKI